MSSDTPLSVLIVDDNRDAADSLAIYLKLRGCLVRVVYDGMEAIQVATADPPDCIVLDIGMPGMDGLAVARELRAATTTSKTPLVALTGYADEQMRSEARAAGFDRHLAKGDAAPESAMQALTELKAARAEEDRRRLLT